MSDGNQEEEVVPRFIRACERITEKAEQARSSQCAGILYSDDAIESLDSASASYEREGRHIVEEEHKQRIRKALHQAREANRRAFTLFDEAIRDLDEALREEGG